MCYVNNNKIEICMQAEVLVLINKKLTEMTHGEVENSTSHQEECIVEKRMMIMRKRIQLSSMLISS